MKNLLIFSFLVPMSFSCAKPKACIEVNKVNAAVNEEITFTSCSEHAHDSDWDFDDGTTLIGDVVKHAYSHAGTYTVQMTAHSYEDRKGSDHRTISVIVH